MAADKNYSSEIDAIRSDVKSLRDDVSALVSALGSDLGAKGDDIKQAAAERIKKARKKGEDGLHQVEHVVEENPMTSLMAALGIGFLIGALLNRR